MTAPDVNADAVPRRLLGIRIRRFRGKLLVAVADNVYELTDSAADIFTWIDGRATVGSLSARLSEAYDVSAEESSSDVTDFVNWLVDSGLAET